MEHPFTFGWKELTLWIDIKNTSFWSTKNTKKIVLENECGRFLSNSLIAIIGPSGVGKTTFLGSLAGKRREVTGSFAINNKVVPRGHLKYISGYLNQNDIFMESLTVFEYFKFMNILKSRQLPEVIEKIIQDLNLGKSKDTQIKYASGGEKKRLSLGIELLNDPCILFCDEPTTGVDSYSAVRIIELLENHMQKGKLIFVTIHQPSSQIFDYFTHIILISQHKICYQGERSEIKDHFERLNLVCPINYNPSDFYLRCITSENKHPLGTYRNKCLLQDTLVLETNTSEDFHQLRNSSFFKEVYWLLWRNTIDTRRMFSQHAFESSVLMVTAIILAVVYSFIPSNNENFVQNVRGIIFFFTSELIFTHTYNVINTFPEEYHILLREKEIYSTKAYFASKILGTIPRNIIQPLMFLAINFVLIDFLRNFWIFAQMFAVSFCACMSASILGLCISAVFTSLEYMDMFTAPFELITMLAAGIFVKLPSLEYFSWIKYLSPFYYTYESLSIIYWSNMGEMECKNSSLVCYKNGKEVLLEFGFHTEIIDIYKDMLFMALLSTTFALIGYLVICYKRNKHALI